MCGTFIAVDCTGLADLTSLVVFACLVLFGDLYHTCNLMCDVLFASEGQQCEDHFMQFNNSQKHLTIN